MFKEYGMKRIGHLVTFIIFLVPNMIDSQRKCSLDKLSSFEYESPKDKFYSNILFLLARPLRSNRRCKHCESPSNPFHFWFFRQFPLSNFSSSSSFLTVRSPIKKTYTGSRSDHDLLLSSFVRERTFVFTFAYNRRSISSGLRSFFAFFLFPSPPPLILHHDLHTARVITSEGRKKGCRLLQS